MNLDKLVESVELGDEYDGLPAFAVGGAVRDAIRGVEPNDVDLMVAEVTPEEMKYRGFTEVDNSGNDTFAVFIDSQNREVAIAREESPTETQGDNAHHDFEVTPVPADVEASEAVKRDLKRRDFTINAMALDLRHNVLHDRNGSVRDLNAGMLRHVTDAFRDDPLRILRGARFAARFDFEIVDETKELMSEEAGRLLDMPGERIRMELEKTLNEAQKPRKFFDVLDEVGALKYAFPTLRAMQFVPAGPDEYHEEGSTFEHTMMVLEEMHGLVGNDEFGLLMALFHDAGKVRTPASDLPGHPGHGQRGVEEIEMMNEAYNFSNEQLNAMKLAAKHHMRLNRPKELNETTLFDAFVELGEHRNRLIRLMVADGRGRVPESEYDHLVIEDAFQRATDAIAAVGAQDLMDEGHDPDEMGGKKFGNLLRQRRVEKMRSYK